MKKRKTKKQEPGFDAPLPMVMTRRGPGVAQTVRLYELYAAHLQVHDAYVQPTAGTDLVLTTTTNVRLI